MARMTKRIGAIVAAGAVLSLATIPAFAATGDVWATKSNDAAGPVPNGGTVNYTIDLWNPTATDQNNLDVGDIMDPGLVYVPESTVLTGTLYSLAQVAYDDLPADPDGGSHTDYNLGTGWSSNWTEVNDDGVSNTGRVRWTGLNIDQNSIGLFGLAATPASPLDYPGVTRVIDPAQLNGLVDAELSFETDTQMLTADDRLGVWVSTDGGANWSSPVEYLPGTGFGDANPGVILRGLDLSPYLPASSLMLRFAPSAGEYAFDGTPSANDAQWAVDLIDIDGVYGYDYGYDNAPGGIPYPNLLGGTPDGLIIPADNIHIPGVVSFDGINYTSGYTLTYAATVDTSATINFDTELENEVLWRSSSYGADAFNSDTSYVDVDYAPSINVDVTSNGPVQTGEPIVITVVIQHSNISDGSPVCVTEDGVTWPAGATAVNAVASGGNQDDCLDAGETWTFTLTYPPSATAGVLVFQASLAGRSVNAGEGDDVDVNANADTDVTVTLAATGPASGSAAGLAAALVALGTAAIVIARRRTA